MLYKIFFQNNDFASMDISEGSLTEQILYQEFIRAFGPPSQEITQEQWRRDMMIIVTNLGVNPICDGHPTITLDPKQRSLGPIAGRIIDCEITSPKTLARISTLDQSYNPLTLIICW